MARTVPSKIASAALVLVFLASTLTSVRGVGMVMVNDESRLVGLLLDNYDHLYGRLIRPVEHHNDSVKVTVGVSLISVYGDSTADNMIVASCWVMLDWTDPLLRWDAADFAGIRSLRIPPNRIWTPDITSFTRPTLVIQPEVKSTAVVYSNGRISVLVPMYLTLAGGRAKDADPTTPAWYSVSLGSWVYNSNQLDVEPSQPTVDVSSLRSNSDLHLVNSTASRQAFWYECCPDEVYPNIAFRISLVERED